MLGHAAMPHQSQRLLAIHKHQAHSCAVKALQVARHVPATGNQFRLMPALSKQEPIVALHTDLVDLSILLL